MEQGEATGPVIRSVSGAAGRTEHLPNLAHPPITLDDKTIFVPLRVQSEGTIRIDSARKERPMKPRGWLGAVLIVVGVGLWGYAAYRVFHPTAADQRRLDQLAAFGRSDLPDHRKIYVLGGFGCLALGGALLKR